ncbi:MAG: D-sedoheptulose 7-phosphate isomerase [Prevotellaceae bacterium]|jgi:D-sedoheptulose 7-phosphate isomerase|nr:D-sedoheptulose 7-phosphate isomerase [Prevotellaceae bacterium]
MDLIIQQGLKEAAEKLHQFLNKPSNLEDIKNAAKVMSEALKNGHKIISCGNGGSLCDATHFAEELTGRYRKNRLPLPAIAINDPAYMTCVGNDFSFDEIFSRYVEGVGQAGDVLLAISTSGNSLNILKAAASANKKGMKIVALTCDTENPLRKVSDVAICAPASDYSDRVQEIHIKVIHIIIQLIEQLNIFIS